MAKKVRVVTPNQSRKEDIFKVKDGKIKARVNISGPGRGRVDKTIQRPDLKGSSPMKSLKKKKGKK